jgi:hypothetical protein
MASTYSGLKIELIGLGEQVGTWGTTTNTNLGTTIEQAIVGKATVNFSTDANKTLNFTNTNAAQDARALFLEATSSVSLSATRDLIVPAINKTYIVKNSTTGGQSIRVISVGTGVTIPSGKTAILYNDATNVSFQFDYAGALSLAGDLIAGGNVTAYSDIRLKTNLQQIPDALAKVESLTGYTYTRTDTGERQTGLVAQDVEKVLPEAVVQGEHLALAYGNMVGLLVEAIKELSDRIEKLEAK